MIQKRNGYVLAKCGKQEKIAIVKGQAEFRVVPHCLYFSTEHRRFGYFNVMSTLAPGRFPVSQDSKLTQTQD
jgi:hypothetical protein